MARENASINRNASFRVCSLPARSTALCRYYNLMRTSGGNAVADDSGDEGKLKCTVAIKEIQVPHANKWYGFRTLLMRLPTEDQLHEQHSPKSPKKALMAKAKTR